MWMATTWSKTVKIVITTIGSLLIISMIALVIGSVLLLSTVKNKADNAIDLSRQSLIRSDVDIVTHAVCVYYSVNGQYPKELNTLVVDDYLYELPKHPDTDNEYLKYIVNNKTATITGSMDGTTYENSCVNGKIQKQ